MERKRVLIVVTKSVWGGAQRYVYDLAECLPKEGYEVFVAAGGTGALVERLKEHHTPVAALALPAGRMMVGIADLSMLISLVRIIRRDRPDIVHLNSSKVGLLGALAAHFAGVRNIVFTVHGWEFNNPARNIFSKLLMRLSYWLTLLLVRKVIAVSEAVRKGGLSFPFVQRKFFVVKNGIESPAFLSKNEARTALSDTFRDTSEIGGTWIGTIAELHPVKGIDTALKAMRILAPRYPELHYFVIGEGAERKKLEQKISMFGLAGKVHLLGYRKDAARYLKAFDLFVLPSRSEAFGYVVLEAAAAELPVVASHIGGIPELIDSGENGLLVPAGADQPLAEALGRLIQNPEKAREYGTKLNRSLNSLTRERMAAETAALYESLGRS